ncbi:NAD(P)/FAD-dependent oxidoreductase [Actinomadura sp. WMMA1423]|uniref:FAD-dependent oxidoreductase n=1 Tax=Actinomadura sp. WMMA1423 TaxID=2591108 RepID=UPI0011467B8D|nr:FAD-dependent monooxygenase [Actinomadura sp. WMMA1423]
MTEPSEHAVVVGGSLAGLLSARILADHFARVTLIERDRFTENVESRPGLGQARHLHVLWSRGLEIAEGLFPGLEDELRVAGVPEVRVPADMLWLTSAGWRRRFESTRLLTFSRDLLDWTVRSRLAKDEKVRLLSGHEVTGLTADGGTVTGVEVRERGTTARGEPLTADLVVDATGRVSKTPAWLERIGYPAPPQTRIDPLLGYASRNYAVPSGFDPGWKALYLQAKAPGTRTGALFPQEGGRWIVSLFGVGEDYPPTDEEGFLEFAKSLRSPVLYEAIREAEPLTPVVSYRRTDNHRRHYERMSAWPKRFVVVGDALCAFNPLYGQGMTVAAKSALTLDACLRADGDLDRLAGRFHRWAVKNAAGPWLVATGEDLRYGTTKGASAGVRTRILNRYVDRVQALANVDPRVCDRFVDVLALTAPPESLFLPEVLWRAVTKRTPQPTGPDDLAP